MTSIFDFEDIFKKCSVVPNNQVNVTSSSGFLELSVDGDEDVIAKTYIDDSQTSCTIPNGYLGSTASLDSYIRSKFNVSIKPDSLQPFIIQTIRFTTPPWKKLCDIDPWRVKLIRNIFGFKTYEVRLDERYFYMTGWHNIGYDFSNHIEDIRHAKDPGFLTLVNAQASQLECTNAKMPTKIK
jgi:hypothetical protein